MAVSCDIPNAYAGEIGARLAATPVMPSTTHLATQLPFNASENSTSTAISPIPFIHILLHPLSMQMRFLQNNSKDGVSENNLLNTDAEHSSGRQDRLPERVRGF